MTVAPASDLGVLRRRVHDLLLAHKPDLARNTLEALFALEEFSLPAFLCYTACLAQLGEEERAASLLQGLELEVEALSDEEKASEENALLVQLIDAAWRCIPGGRSK